MKEFFAKLWQNKKLMWILGGVCVAVIAAIVIAVVALGGQGDTEPTGDVSYTVEVKTEGGMALAGLDVFVYTDTTLQDIETFGKTDENGIMRFTAPVSDSYVVTLTGVARGYDVADTYAITGETTQIVLKAELLKDADLSSLTLGLGDVMFDFTVTTPDGTSYTLSELLKEKNAVVLNFWFANCEPCKGEFPYLQEAYDASENVALLAVNPLDDDAAITQFMADQGLTMPMVSVDSQWETVFQLNGYPTTVVIDRYGTISLIHTGPIDDTQTFADIFDYFTAEAYQQQTLSSVEDMYSADGSAERPYEFGGVKEFEVTVEPGKVVYCDVYKVSGMELTIQDSDVYVLYEEETYKAEDGAVRLVVTSPDTFTPVKLGIGNNGSATKTVKVTFAELPGTMGNPYTLEMGEFTVDIAAGNSQGVYYTYTAAEEGIVSMQCTGAAEGVEYGFTLYNLTTGAYRTLDTDAVDGIVTVEVHAGDELQFSASTLPNDENEYPAASLSFTASFAQQEIAAPTAPTEPEATDAPQSGTNTGGSTGGNTGGNTGGSTGDSTGDSTDTGTNGTNIGQYTELYVGEALNVGTGTTNVTLTAGKLNYFLFTPTESGTYQFTASETIGYYNNPIYIYDATAGTDYANNTFTVSIDLGGSCVLGIKAGRKVTSGTLTITRIGDANFNVINYKEYIGSYTPTAFTFTGDVNAMTYVDITGSTSIYKLTEKDGYYYIGDKQVFLNLSTSAPYSLSMEGILLSDRPVIRSAEKEEEYTELVKKYVDCMDTATGLYPLTKDMAYVLQMFGAGQDWWSAERNGFLYSQEPGLNPEIAWMYACCYVN